MDEAETRRIIDNKHRLNIYASPGIAVRELEPLINEPNGYLIA